jgi:hypothetical protein
MPLATPTTTIDTTRLERTWLDKANGRRVACWTLVFLAMIWGMAPWLSRSVAQPIWNEWVVTGQGLASFPMWGYSLCARWFGSLTAIYVLQSVLGAAATAALLVRLNSLCPRLAKVTTTLFVLALPWLSFMAYAYQMPMSSSLVVFALLSLDTALRTGRIAWGAVAGAFFGVGQNFRSELLLLPAAVLVVALLASKLRWISRPAIGPLAVCAGVAFAIQIPWAINCHANAGRFSLTESNLGHVLFEGLGQIPDNPWNILASDQFAQDTVTAAGLECSSLSFEGGDYLKRRSIEAALQEPAAVVQGMGRRLVFTVYFPFGFLPLAATPEEESASRRVVGMINPWAARRVEEPAVPATVDVSRIKVGLMVLYVVVQGILVRAVSVLGLIGLVLAVKRGPFRLSEPILLCLGVAIAYRFAMNVLICPAGKYMTGVYLCYLPFTANALWASSRLWLRPRPAAHGDGSLTT